MKKLCPVSASLVLFLTSWFITRTESVIALPTISHSNLIPPSHGSRDSLRQGQKELIESEQLAEQSEQILQQVNATTRDRLILLAFKKAITQDPTGALRSWNDSQSGGSHCTWSGVKCRGNTQTVYGLLLDSRQLHGSLTPLLGELPYLAYLNLSNNSFSESIPPQLGQLPLTHLDLSANSLSGEIPDSLANCTHLQYLDLNRNSLSATLSSFLPKLTSLVYLDLSSNPIRDTLPSELRLLVNLQFFLLYSANLTGEIPLSLVSNWTELVWLDLYDNHLKGSLPSDWSKFANLEHLYLWGNGFVGSIPASLSNCSKLREIHLELNYLTGGIPAEFGRLARLQNLKLYSNSLSGSVPTSLGNCTNLVTLQLSANNFSGIIPQHIGQLQQVQWLVFAGNGNLEGVIPDSIGNCSQLTILAIAVTKVGGTLPSSLFGLSNLTILDLSSSQFSGPIPEQFSRLIMLQRMDLHLNFFKGEIPEELGELESLESLVLAGNNLTGPVPAELARCRFLLELDLSQNALTGSIPSTLGQLESLNKLYLHQNQLSGSIPDSLGRLMRLENLTLSCNRLTGSIPDSLGNLKALAILLDLSHNLLTGSIPSVLGGIVMLQVMNLSANNLTGEIPASLAGCVGLQMLDLSANRLEGSIPGNLASLRSLEHLDLSENELSGELPSSLGSLQYLDFLNVSGNQLEGPIPVNGVYRNFSSTSFLGNPGLCGPVLDTSCKTASSLPRENPRSRVKIIVIAASASAVGAFVVVVICACWCYHGVQTPDKLQSVNSFGLVKPQFTVRELKAATNDFSDSNVIGAGSVSICYKGILEDKRKGLKRVVAIKKLNNIDTDASTEARRSFKTELKTLCRMRHRHLVRVLGYCWESSMIALVLELMENGNLDDHLHRPGGVRSAGRILRWEDRLGIALDIAEGLVYLHHEYDEPVIHCDLKPRNILLGSDMVARIADFGIAKLGRLEAKDEGGGLSSISTFRGSFGYAAPEFASGSRISTKADVYSFGVLLLEMLTGRRPTSELLQADGVSLASWVQSAYERGRTRDVLDPVLLQLDDDADIDAGCKGPMKLLWIGLMCAKEAAGERPTMRDVREMLVQLKQDGTPSPWYRPLEDLLADNVVLTSSSF